MMLNLSFLLSLWLGDFHIVRLDTLIDKHVLCLLLESTTALMSRLNLGGLVILFFIPIPLFLVICLLIIFEHACLRLKDDSYVLVAPADSYFILRWLFILGEVFLLGQNHRVHIVHYPSSIAILLLYRGLCGCLVLRTW